MLQLLDLDVPEPYKIAMVLQGNFSFPVLGKTRPILEFGPCNQLVELVIANSCRYNNFTIELQRQGAVHVNNFSVVPLHGGFCRFPVALDQVIQITSPMPWVFGIPGFFIVQYLHFHSGSVGGLEFRFFVHTKDDTTVAAF